MWIWFIRWTRTLRDPIETEMVNRVDIVNKVDEVDLVDYVDNVYLVDNVDIWTYKTNCSIIYKVDIMDSLVMVQHRICGLTLPSEMRYITGFIA